MAGRRENGEEDPTGEETWRFDLDDVDDEGIVQPGIEPGDPSPENVLFVVLGALAMVLVIVHIWSLLP